MNGTILEKKDIEHKMFLILSKIKYTCFDFIEHMVCVFWFYRTKNVFRFYRT